MGTRLSYLISLRRTPYLVTSFPRQQGKGLFTSHSSSCLYRPEAFVLSTTISQSWCNIYLFPATTELPLVRYHRAASRSVMASLGWSRGSLLLTLAICLVLLPGRAHAFGAGNIPSIAQVRSFTSSHFASRHLISKKIELG